MIRLCLLSVLMLMPLAQAKSQANRSVTFSTSFSIAPFFTEDRHNGIQYQLLKQALQHRQLTLGDIAFTPPKRALRLLLAGQVDCLINAPPGLKGMHYYPSLLSYQNSIFLLADNQRIIEQVADLAHIRLAAFQNASHYLGAEFAKMARLNPDYSEIANQSNQVAMLLGNRVEAIVLERRIFAYNYQKLAEKKDSLPPVREVSLFEEAPRFLACRDPEIAAEITAGIEWLYEQGVAERILAEPPQFDD
ncbi:amino acid ABC transporter [Shewanella algae]|uniref:amino acid ABC transporter n=1 Tax=Shewanella algae TaxID=38313 RepID=UPI00313BF73F